MSQLDKLIDKKIVKLIRVFYKNKTKFYHITQLAKEANVPAATTLRLIKQLVSSQFITINEVGKFKIYKYNENQTNNNLMGLLSK